MFGRKRLKRMQARLQEALVVKNDMYVQAQAKIQEQGGIIESLHRIIESSNRKKDVPYGMSKEDASC